MIRGETPSDLVFFLLLVSINSSTCWQCTVKSACKNHRYLSSKKRKRFLIFAVMKLVLKRIEEDINCWAAFHVNLAYIPSIPGLWQMFRTFVLRCDWSILRILKSTKKHERQSERVTLVSIYNNIFRLYTAINTWFIKLLRGKDLQSYTHIDLSEIRTLFNA